jgi:hypothetical protein
MDGSNCLIPCRWKRKVQHVFCAQSRDTEDWPLATTVCPSAFLSIPLFLALNQAVYAHCGYRSVSMVSEMLAKESKPTRAVEGGTTDLCYAFLLFLFPSFCP